MIGLSPDERRVVQYLTKRAELYEQAQQANPFSFHGIRAKLCRALAGAIGEGRHR